MARGLRRRELPAARAARRAAVALEAAPVQVTTNSPSAAYGAQGLTAAATRVDIGALAAKRTAKNEADWQTEAWHHWRRCGELQYAAQWMANSLSRVRLYAAEVGDDGRPGKPAENPVVKKIAMQLFGGPGRASQMMAALGIHLTVPGDCWLICKEQPGQAADDWFVISTSELVKKNGKLGLDRGNGFEPIDESSTVLIRVWLPDPQRHDLATSATRSVLPVLRELEKLDEHVHAVLESRLPAGILFVPDQIDFLSPDPEAQAATGSIGGLMTTLTEAMLAAVEDHSSPAGIVPIMAKVPGEMLDKVQHISFGMDIVTSTDGMREACIRRLALGLDMPPEELLGKGDSSHWSSWQIEESGVKVHVEPKVLVIAAALTEAYFRPALRAAGIPNPEDFVLWHDVSELVLRPNRADMSKELWADDGIGLDVMLREAGFNPETDKPTPEEFERKVLLDLMAKQPMFAHAILAKLGIDIDLPDLAPITRADEIGPDGQPTKVQPEGEKKNDGPPADDEPKGQSSPAQKKGGGSGPKPVDAKKAKRESEKADMDPLAFAREIAVETLVSRGLEYANKKLLTRGRRGTFTGDIRRFYLDGGISVTREAVPRLIEGAWAYLPEVAGTVALDPARLEQMLTDHIGGLLITGEVHDRRYSRTIAAACRLAADDGGELAA